jgi:SAM-dependent methyltransferase
MAHKEQKEFCMSVKRQFPDYFTKKVVLDIGSGDVNGNNNQFFSDCFVLGNDIGYGPNVDLLGFAHELPFVDEYFDTVISTECFEHDRHYDKTLNAAVRMLKSGGLFVFSCATTGRPEHGTSRSKPYQVFSTRVDGLEDYYKNLTEVDIRKVLDIGKHFSDYEFSVNNEHHDLYFWGIKR